MPIFLKNKPIGKDAAIQAIQRILYAKLNPAWGIDLQAYGRAYLNDKDGNVVPEVHTSGKDYSGTLLTSDKSKFFFIETAKSEPYGQNSYKTMIDICFIVDLAKVRPEVPHRADAEVQADVEKVLKDLNHLNIAIEKCTTGIKEVFRGLFFKSTSDMQPKHVFKFTVALIYQMQQTEC